MSVFQSAASTTAVTMKKSAVLYHYPCPDGAFAALAAHLYFTHCPTVTNPPPLFFPNTVYSPLRLEDLPLHKIDDVYLLDFVGPPGFIQRLSSNVERVVVLDHHKTTLEILGSAAPISENEIKVLDMERSGATIAYDYFMEKLLRADVPFNIDCVLAEFQRMRRIFEYIEDGDLWRWHLPHSKAFSSGVKDLNLEFDVTLNPKLFHQLLSLDLDSVIRQGMSSLAEKQRLINEVLKQSEEIALGGGAFGNCLAVNADSVYELRSELGNQLANKSRGMNLRGIGAIVYRVPDLQNNQLLKISLRSVDDEDTTSISQLTHNLSCEERPTQILSRQERKLRNKVIKMVKVKWLNHSEEEATWETERDMRSRYPELFGIWRWRPSKCQFIHVAQCGIPAVEGFRECLNLSVASHIV